MLSFSINSNHSYYKVFDRRKSFSESSPPLGLRFLHLKISDQVSRSSRGICLHRRRQFQPQDIWQDSAETLLVGDRYENHVMTWHVHNQLFSCRHLSPCRDRTRGWSDGYNLGMYYFKGHENYGLDRSLHPCPPRDYRIQSMSTEYMWGGSSIVDPTRQTLQPSSNIPTIRPRKSIFECAL